MATVNFVYPYRAGSRSALAVAKGLEGKLIALKNSKFKPNANKLVINWGSTELPQDILDKCKVLNHPNFVARASNKLKFFQLCKEAGEAAPRIPEFTTEKKVALEWLEKEPKLTIFARTALAGYGGQGIVKITSKEELGKIPEGTLLVKYVPKKREFRLHVSKKQGVFVSQEKLKKAEVPVEKVDFQIRNHDNGFIFAKQNLEVPQDAIEQAEKALAVTELDFGAIDVIWNQSRAMSYVLEVNTAPGLEGSTIESYLKEIGLHK